ncbi:helix-turn-helix transcriptional regulator [Acrocarpospora phusangensis]|uniref:helix-turn-helix transcriptional regulator n=1 Tax=Acrocarpospora phusangensis TaxID=1070424 RepID=UPI0019520973|nr:LuxR family transcriptional regulator [Acrocarpospora phusangensis]
MRGRRREWRAVAEVIRAAGDGQGAVLLVESQAGMGKSRLLAEAGAAARARGFALAAGAAEELAPLIPMAPLFMAAGQSPELAGPDLHTRLLEQLRAALAARTPLLVTVDDLQWADPTTLTAVRSLQWRLAELPVGWILARTVTEGHREVDCLFDILERQGARRLLLPPLSPPAVAELCADLLGAEPDAGLLALAETANGSPALLVELLEGLRDEDRLDVRGGVARVLSERVPERLCASVRQRLDLLSAEARHLVETAAVLGRSFRLEAAAELLSSAPAPLLPALEEAITAGVLVPGPAETLRFQQEILWRAVVSGLPPAVRRALHRQADDVRPSRDAAGESGVLAALRRGDLAAAAERAEADRAALPPEAAQARLRCDLLAAEVVEARDGAEPAMALVRHLYAEPCRWLLTAEPAAAPWLVRLALAVGRREPAERVAELAGRDPRLAAAAAHARGLLRADPVALARAARTGADPWCRASAAEDLGALLAESGERPDALGNLGEALSGYDACGATRDAARVRRRMRRLGVRHRHWSTGERPASGWDSLTATELRVSLLVAQGWTNRQVADQLFISVHTVAFHLRQVFRKLEIGSRVALARLAAQRSASGE